MDELEKGYRDNAEMDRALGQEICLEVKMDYPIMQYVAELEEKLREAKRKTVRWEVKVCMLMAIRISSFVLGGLVGGFIARWGVWLIWRR